MDDTWNLNPGRLINNDDHSLNRLLNLCGPHGGTIHDFLLFEGNGELLLSVAFYKIHRKRGKCPNFTICRQYKFLRILLRVGILCATGHNKILGVFATFFQS